MKKPGETKPLQIVAKLTSATPKSGAIEWSRLSDKDHDTDLEEIAPFKEKPIGALKRFREWIDHHIGANQPETRMLRRLHRTDRLEIHLTEENQPDLQLKSELQNYWLNRESKHKRLALLTGILLLPSLLLTVIPGPNVIGIGLTYLVYHHWRITQGIRRVRAGTIEVELRHASPATNQSAIENDPMEYKV